jgi:hypothetical protein
MTGRSETGSIRSFLYGLARLLGNLSALETEIAKTLGSLILSGPPWGTAAARPTCACATVAIARIDSRPRP